ncbi:MAG: c-type cytochrome [Pikeienuella sp.]|uniref:c-type cytochrome n=1 Tax=Pikeienuella sp. TaxID=2831957 RepID=UPI00391A7668
MGRYAFWILAGALIFAAWLFWSTSNDQKSARDAYENSYAVPPLAPGAEAGRLAFNETCATCHGRDAMGGEGGPPLIHRIYEPSHHGDDAFRLAISQGVRAHHWDFGDMPAQPGVGPEETETIIAFVRAVQAANGIE